MVTKEQALTATSFKQVAMFKTEQRMGAGCMLYRIPVDIANPIPLNKSVNWRANGKCKTWKRDTTRFSLPIKHGLYNYGYITNDNAHLFEVV